MIELGLIALLGVLAIPVTLRIDRGLGIERLVGQSLLMGLGIASLSLYTLSLLAIRWHLAAAMSIVLGCTIVASWSGPRNLAARVAAQPLRASAGQRIGSLVCDAFTLLSLTGYGLFVTVSAPAQWDYWAIWGLKAKAFWFSRSIDWGFLLDPLTSFSHQDYPLLLPLLYDFLGLARGAWNDRWLGIAFLVFAAATVLVVRGLIREETGSVWYASFVGFMVTGPLLSPWVGMADLPFNAFATTSALLLRRGLKTNDPHPFRAGAVLLGFASLTKNEGVAFILAVALAVIVETRALRRVVALWPAFALAASWQLARIPMGLSTDLFAGSVLSRVWGHLGEAGRVWSFFRHHSVERPLLWLVLAIILLGGIRFVARQERFLATVVAVQSAFYVAAFLATPLDIVWHLDTAWTRTTEQLLPLLIVLASLVCLSWLEHDSDSLTLSSAMTP